MFGGELSDQNLRFFSATFSALKQNDVNVSLSLGRDYDMADIQRLHFAGVCVKI